MCLEYGNEKIIMKKRLCLDADFFVVFCIFLHSGYGILSKRQISYESDYRNVWNLGGADSSFIDKCI